jgi:hypothetical protein
VPPGGEHGYSGYRNYGCRCETCVKAHEFAREAWRAILKAGVRIMSLVKDGEEFVISREDAGEAMAIADTYRDAIERDERFKGVTVEVRPYRWRPKKGQYPNIDRWAVWLVKGAT